MQSRLPSSFGSCGRAFRSALAAVLLAGALPTVHAAALTFSGTTDSGPLAGLGFGGRLVYRDPLPDFDGLVDLGELTLAFAGQTYTLGTADAGSVAGASFVTGRFVGIDYRDSSSAGAGLRPGVYLTAGFVDLGEAFFSYDTTGNGVQGFGSYAVAAVSEPLPVREPGGPALLLLGLGLLSAVSRRWGRRRSGGGLARQARPGPSAGARP